MNVKSLREGLGGIGLSSDELASLDAALRPLDDMTMEQFCSQLAKIKVPKRKSVPTPDGSLVSKYLEELKGSRGEFGAFTAVLDRVRADRTVKAREAILLAQAFLGDQREYKSKPLALKAIATRQFNDERLASRKGKVSGIF
ncbi:MAG: hypothetical protein K2Y42_08830 [Hyphomicrobium sp.]|jgi:hypothetical protein|uniref:hypothetical protein n=1 Tax=Hyphomicrobium sp. TaxID=82 RepID=UPI0025BC47E8|nr:hypothetical protein [Hyphomicrobium sp.]MBX9862843.1 hypothetical protein [Hyphomicrobium sp.]